MQFLWRRAKLESHLGIVRPEVANSKEPNNSNECKVFLCVRRKKDDILPFWAELYVNKTSWQIQKLLRSLIMLIFYCKQYVCVSADEYTFTEEHAIVRPTYSICFWNIPACKTDYFVSKSNVNNAQMLIF